MNVIQKKYNTPCGESVERVVTFDRCNAPSAHRPLCSSLFVESIYRREAPSSAMLERGALMVEISAAMVCPSQMVVMVGSSPMLGQWSPAEGVVLMDGEHPRWRTPSLPISEELLCSEYKFVLVDRATGDVVAWEEGANRSFAECREGVGEGDSIYVIEAEPRFNIEAWRGAGVAIPLFSLRSEESMGIGDFGDLQKMVDWAVLAGQQIIQILPINDTIMTGTWMDSYPYNANSIFALHPQYLSLRRAGVLRDASMQVECEAEGRRLNALADLDYVGVNELKGRYLRQLYAECGEQTLQGDGYREFFDANRYWLESYALFSLLRDRYNTPDFSQWSTESTYSEALMARYREDSAKELGYYYFVQYHLHIQLLEARHYALSRGVAFKGDIPIGVSRTSVDVWVAPHLFRLDSQAGAPPDDFSVLGQNWGFPTYNWEAMARDGYAWWKARFAKMAEYFDAYRIDHILGFFRIWEIPLDAVHGLLGYFNPALPYSVEELRERYDFDFDSSYVRPDINGWLLEELFGEAAEAVAEEYFDVSEGAYQFKERYSTQAKVVAEVADEALQASLLLLFDEVLFVEDPYKHGLYHPRISVQGSYKYRAMSGEDKSRFDRLYNDFYYHRHNDYWRDEAMKKLPVLISATNMLTCGEDLGMIPHCVPEVMDREQILSLEIQRMPKDPSVSFGEPWNYPYRSVSTTSTHDMNPLRAWLREDRDLSNIYFRDLLSIDYTMGDDCDGWVCERIVKQHLDSPSMWVILPLQDWLSIDDSLRSGDPESERINVPSSSRHYWRYRMHITIESLIENEEFTSRVAELARAR